jgi:hypothetical protein
MVRLWYTKGERISGRLGSRGIHRHQTNVKLPASSSSRDSQTSSSSSPSISAACACSWNCVPISQDGPRGSDNVGCLVYDAAFPCATCVMLTCDSPSRPISRQRAPGEAHRLPPVQEPHTGRSRPFARTCRRRRHSALLFTAANLHTFQLCKTSTVSSSIWKLSTSGLLATAATTRVWLSQLES